MTTPAPDDPLGELSLRSYLQLAVQLEAHGESAAAGVIRLLVDGVRARGAVERLQALHAPSDSYACQRCGRRDGLDTVLPNEVWARITEGRLLTVEVVDGKWNLLCLWCIDALCLEHGIETTASLHFAGRAVVGMSQSAADQEHISRLAAQRGAVERERDEAKRENEHLQTLLATAKQERDTWHVEVKRRVATSTYSVIRGAVLRAAGLPPAPAEPS